MLSRAHVGIKLTHKTNVVIGGEGVRNIFGHIVGICQVAELDGTWKLKAV